MNQGRIWTVVKPTVGLPLLIGSAAVTSLLVHYAILSHTTWYPSYWEGGHHKVSMETSSTAVSALETAPAFTVVVKG
jgi:light-harvesting protein B-800-850 alpha chain